ncbi:MAG: hypothetical protein HY747_00850 [Elusimicrobia bacterium]|nr:hypothetical protein [Elusimicrobiota bacterium]
MNFVSEKTGAEVKLAASEPAKKRYEISLAGERLKVIEEKWLKQAKNSARIAGFRRGKTPDNILISAAGDWIKEKSSREVFSEVVGEILKKEDLKIICAPLIAKVEYQYAEHLKFEAVFEIEPVITIKNYKGFELERRLKPVTDEEVEDGLKRILREGAAQYLMPVAGSVEAQADYLVEANLKCAVGGEPVMDLKNEMFAADDECLPLGMREAVKGMKAGESKSWQALLDDDCPVSALAGKKAEFQLELLEVKRLESQSGSQEELYKTHGEQIPKWKDQLRLELMRRCERFARKQLEDQVAGDLLLENPIDVSQTETDIRTHELLERAKALFAISNKELDAQHEQELRVKYGIEAANEIRLAYLMREIAARENIKAGEDDFQRKLESAPDEKDKQELLKNKDAVLYDILTEKVYDFLIANAKITDVEV